MCFQSVWVRLQLFGNKLPPIKILYLFNYLINPKWSPFVIYSIAGQPLCSKFVTVTVYNQSQKENISDTDFLTCHRWLLFLFYCDWDITVVSQMLVLIISWVCASHIQFCSHETLSFPSLEKEGSQLIANNCQLASSSFDLAFWSWNHIHVLFGWLSILSVNVVLSPSVLVCFEDKGFTRLVIRTTAAVNIHFTPETGGFQPIALFLGLFHYSSENTTYYSLS